MSRLQACLEPFSLPSSELTLVCEKISSVDACSTHSIDTSTVERKSDYWNLEYFSRYLNLELKAMSSVKPEFKSGRIESSKSSILDRLARKEASTESIEGRVNSQGEQTTTHAAKLGRSRLLDI